MHLLNRRRLLKNFTLGAAGLWVPGALAEALTLTPKQTEGPFYPVDLPLDTDNDLILLNDGLTPALGNITHLTGRVTDMKGEP
ncbi:MAG: intradiol ring-cleavage dioxygenase, partial [Verrucomicrobiaceae bacterium]